MTWSDVVWGSAVLRGIDARAQREIEAAGALLSFEEGATIFKQGEPADSFFVIEEGDVVVRAIPRGEGELRVIREAHAGEAFGEDATLRAGGSRQMEAVCRSAVKVARVPAPVFARATERGGGGEVAADRRRSLQRAGTLDLLRTMAYTRRLPERDLEELLDAAHHIALARGAVLFREGERATHVYFIGEGLLQVQTEDDDKLHVKAYLGRGDVVGDAELALAESRRTSAVATGASFVIAIERRAFLGVAERHPALLDELRRVVEKGEDNQLAIRAGVNTTQHVFKDLYRLQVARSLLVIDQNACVRCGHCASSCASVHDDNVSRLVRRGDKVVTQLEGAGQVPLLVPNSCQHCENPACMPDCPTGAIGRDPRGEVFIREDLCTGCGACAKGCPWDNIQMAPRARSSPGAPAPAPDATGVGTSAEVAVKCDLCHDRDGGPACVAACPTEAIHRIQPSEVLPDVRALLGKEGRAGLFPAPRPAYPFVAGGALAALGIALVPVTSHAGRLATGVACALLVVLLGLHAVAKRSLGWKKLPARTSFIAHVVLGELFVGLACAHGGLASTFFLRADVASSLVVSLAGAIALGGAGAVFYTFLPPRLTRIERAGMLPEDLGERARVLEDRLFRELSGRSDLVKVIFRKILRPYARSPLAPLVLVLSGRTLREEEKRLRARVDRILQGRAGDGLRGLDDLLRVAVERHAIRGQRVLSGILRGWLAPHLVLAVVAAILMVVHAVVASKYR
jgi:Fe-S-cluster-containing dehydrogenase component/CRP-like cAMP-binding protein